MKTYSIKLSFDSGSTWTDYSALLKLTPENNLSPFTRDIKLHQGLKPCSNNLAKFVFRGPIAQIGTLAQQIRITRKVQVKLQVNGVDYFTGYIRRVFSIHRDLVGVKEIECECVDFYYYLKDAIAVSTYSAFNLPVSNPANKNQSLLHQLFYLAGVSDSQLNIPTIGVSIPVVAIGLKDKYLDIIEKILFESCYTCFVDPSGVLQFVSFQPSSITPTATLSDLKGNIVLPNTSYDVSTKEANYEGATVTYKSVVYKSGIKIFNDPSGATGNLSCNISLAAGSYYPSNANATIDSYCNFQVEGYKLLSASNVQPVHYEYSGTLNLLKDINEAKRANVKFYAQTAATISAFFIIGDAYLEPDEGGENQFEHDWISGTTKLFNYTTTYVRDATNTDFLAQVLNNYYHFSQDEYNVSTNDFSLLPGDYVTFQDSVAGIIQVCRVLEINDLNTEQYRTLILEAMSPLVMTSINLVNTTSSSLSVPVVSKAFTGNEYWYLASASQPSIPVDDPPSGWSKAIPTSPLSIWMISGYRDNGLICGRYPSLIVYPPFNPGSYWSKPVVIASAPTGIDTSNITQIVKPIIATSGPKYLGASSAIPSSYGTGDWWFYTGTTLSGLTQYTMYKWNGASWIADSDSGHLSTAFVDLIAVAGQASQTLSIINNLVANTALVNNLTASNAFISNMLANSAFINNLSVKHLNGADGTFSGTLSAASGTFSGSLTAGQSFVSNHVYIADSGVYVFSGASYTNPAVNDTCVHISTGGISIRACTGAGAGWNSIVYSTNPGGDGYWASTQIKELRTGLLRMVSVSSHTSAVATGATIYNELYSYMSNYSPSTYTSYLATGVFNGNPVSLVMWNGATIYVLAGGASTALTANTSNTYTCLIHMPGW